MMIDIFKFYTRHSLNDLRANKQLTFFALLAIAAGVAAVVSLQTLGVMIGDTLTGNLQETNQGDIVIKADPGASSLEVPLLTHANYSPGRILRQNEVAARQAMDELHNAGQLTVETRSGLDQVRFKREKNWLSTIAEYLQGD